MVARRPVLRSVMVFGAVFLAVGGAVGFAAAARDGNAPATFQIPPPRPGDVATYAVSVESAPWASQAFEADFELYQARWMPQSSDVDADGVRHETQVLATRVDIRVTLPAGGAFDYRLYQDAAYDAATGRPFKVTNHVPAKAASGDLFAALPAEAPAALPLGDRGGFWWRYDAYGHWLGPCGFRTTLQQGPQRLDGAIGVEGRCDRGNATGTFAFADGGMGEVDGAPARRLVSLLGDGAEVWYRADLPVPVKVRTSFAEVMDGDYIAGRTFELRLIAFERGAEPYPPAPPPSAAAPDRVETAPREAWGPRDDGIDHPFPLHEAYQTLVDAPDAPAFGRYVRETPGAYLAAAWFWEGTDEWGNAHWNWWMLATDGQSYQGGGVGRNPRYVQGVTLPHDFGTYDHAYEWHNEEVIPADVTGLYPPPALAPARLPTVASAFERYAELRDPRLAGSPALFYGFYISCADIHCRDARGITGAGTWQEDIQLGPVAPTPRDLLEGRGKVIAQLSVDHDGRVRSQYSQTSQDPPFMGLLALAPAGLPADAPAGGPAASVPVWVPPSAPAAAGVGLVALLAAVAYYALAAKGLPFLGLFSRIGNGQVLEHPTRRRVHDAIQAEPGIHFQELARRLGMGHGVLDHHLQKLVAAEIVVKRQAPRYTCFFPKGAVDRRLMDAAPILRSRGGRQVLEAIAAAPGASHRDVAARAGLSPSTVSYHVRRLREAGLVDEATAAGASSLHVTGMGQQAMGAA